MIVTNEQIKKAGKQLATIKPYINYETYCYAIKSIVQNYKEHELTIPDIYKNQHKWSGKQKSRFIETIFLGIPIPLIVLSEVIDECSEIIDGIQRICTLKEFMDNELVLTGLEILTTLNGFNYGYIPKLYRTKFEKTTMHVGILLNATTDIKDRCRATLNNYKFK